MKARLTSIMILLVAVLFQGSEVKSIIRTLDAPVVVAAVAPEYPMLAFQMKAQGEVIEASIVQGHDFLRAPSIQAARRWKFDQVEGSGTRSVRLVFSFVGFYKGQRSPVEDAPVFYPPYRVEVGRSLPTININVG